MNDYLTTSVRINSEASVLQAELVAILLALEDATNANQRAVIFVDSMSALNSISNPTDNLELNGIK